MRNIKIITEIPINENIVIIANKKFSFKNLSLKKDELKYLKNAIAKKNNIIKINQYNRWLIVQIPDYENKGYMLDEYQRKQANELHSFLVENKIKKLNIIDAANNPQLVLSFSEGLALSNYQFSDYKKDNKNSSIAISIFSSKLDKKKLNQLNAIINGVFEARTMVNKPYSHLDSKNIVDEIKRLSKISGFTLKVLDKKDIQNKKMGGILAVNKGSAVPPTFSILEWKPKNAKNKNPIVLIGKGIVYDTGGLSIKPTPNSMDIMKSDMAGAAVVIGAFHAIALAKLPIHVVGLVPATDNAVDNKAYVPGDVITMHNKLSVEVLNTDAEGRLILADALSYAKKYNPEIVIDIATLTGAKIIAVGNLGIAVMGNVTNKVFKQLEISGEKTFERIIKLPIWDDFASQLKSDIADLKNIGGREAGTITAGKFLENFTDYPWIHMDIAGAAFTSFKDSYRGKGGTGIGLRLIFDFIKNI